MHEIMNSSHSFDLRRLGIYFGVPQSIKEERKIPSSSDDVMVNNLQFWGLRNLKLHQITWGASQGFFGGQFFEVKRLHFSQQGSPEFW